MSAEPAHIKTKVVILGAGASGISAAKSLSSAGMQDYVIVDAQSFIGGRLWTGALWKPSSDGVYR